MNIDSDLIVRLFDSPELLAEVNLADRPRVITALRQQKVLAKYAHLLFENDKADCVDDKTQRHLRNALKIAEKQKQQVAFEANEIKAALADVSEFVVFLKGAAYSLNNTEVGKGRIYSDIDVLVNKPDLLACEQSLVFHGWHGEEISDYDDKYYRKWAHEIPPMTHMHRGTSIDVHHNIIPVISKDAPSAESLKAFIVENDSGIQSLNIDAQFVHCAVHLFRNEDYKTAFRDILDLRFMLKDLNDQSLCGVLSVADTLGFRYEVGLALHFVKAIFAVGIEQDLIDSCLVLKPLRKKIDLFIFSTVLLPKHPMIQHKSRAWIEALAELRGHLIKMPLLLLIYHLTVKSTRSVIEAIMGKHFFSKRELT
ncbi:nucleotidyltransferase family protein [Glaciecola sp. MH2013]|uniref:nucleotidyltransferase family protein n=1 Tax=Glaciecola sp. MH2013 TaxID=2785524 RepID=UPI00189DB419|nr:nucleotidyltransferase family protein [Glaciecola sp. MH2013]MBF7072179.1 nucleotidyltransferase family protein [Glaciecola sp. MH2013]